MSHLLTTFHFFSILSREVIISSEETLCAQNGFTWEEEANSITLLRRHSLFQCAEVYYQWEVLLANTAATSLGEGSFFPSLSSTDCSSSCAVSFFFFFLATVRSFLNCSLQGALLLCCLFWVLLHGSNFVASCLILIRTNPTDCQSDLKGRGQEPRGYLLPPMTLPDTETFIKPQANRPEEPTELIWIH